MQYIYIQYIHSPMPCNSRPVEGANDPRSIPVNSNLGCFLSYFWATAHRPRRSLRSSFSFFSRRWADRDLPCATGGLLPPAASFSLPSLPSIPSILLPSATNPERDVWPAHSLPCITPSYATALLGLIQPFTYSRDYRIPAPIPPLPLPSPPHPRPHST